MRYFFEFIKWLFPEPKKSMRLIIAFMVTIGLSGVGSFFSYKYSIVKAEEKIEVAKKSVRKDVEHREQIIGQQLSSQHAIVLGALNNIQANQKENSQKIKEVNRKVWQLSRDIKNN